MDKREKIECIKHAMKEMYKLFYALEDGCREQKRADTIIGKLYELRLIINNTGDEK